MKVSDEDLHTFLCWAANYDDVALYDRVSDELLAMRAVADAAAAYVAVHIDDDGDKPVALAIALKAAGR